MDAQRLADAVAFAQAAQTVTHGGLTEIELGGRLGDVGTLFAASADGFPALALGMAPLCLVNRCCPSLALFGRSSHSGNLPYHVDPVADKAH